MQAIEGYDDFNAFHDHFIVPLLGKAVVMHFQGFPGVYDGEWPKFRETKAHGGPLPVSAMPQTYREQVERAARLDAPFRRLRMLPAVTRLGYSQNEVEVLKNMSRRNVLAGETVRTTSFNEQGPRLRASCPPPNPYVDGYISGAREGISRFSFWSVAEAQPDDAPAPIALRLMSYNAVGELAIQVYGAPYDQDLAAYVDFWHDVYNHDHYSESLKV